MGNTITPAPRLAPLDLLRALAVLLVLGGHLPELPHGCAPEPLWNLARLWEQIGWTGVDLFFVLSGFLISGLLFREHERFGGIRYGHFLARRGFKIYPAFYMMFAVVLMVAAWHGRKIPEWDVLLSEMFFVQNYGPALFPHTWSLAVEEHFYLLLPLLLIVLPGSKQRPFAALPAVFIVTAALMLAARIVNAQSGEFHYKTHLFPTHLRIDSLLFGVVLSWMHFFHGQDLKKFVDRFRWPMLAGALLLLLPVFFIKLGDGIYLHTVGITGMYLSAGVLLLFSLRWKNASAPIAFVGAHSYSIYLWHIPVRFIGLGWLPPGTSPLVRAAVYLVASIGLGIFAARLVETPFLALRDRLFPTRSQPLA